MDTQKLKKAIFRNKPEILTKDIDRLLKPTIAECNRMGKSYGECSGHLYPILPELYRRYEYTARFVLLIRNPVDFVRSALARGFFDSAHPNALEHVTPPKDTAMGSHWSQATALEKCAWYWAMVNGMVYRFFLTVPHTLHTIVQIETLTLRVIEELYDFLGLKDFDRARPAIEDLLSIRHNASPGQGEEKSLNPYSKEVDLGPFDSWVSDQVVAFEKHVQPMQEIIYGRNGLKSSVPESLCFLK
jgi:hypothetical protein